MLGFTHIGRFIFWNYADLEDYRKFPADTIQRSGETFRFTHSENSFKPYNDRNFQSTILKDEPFENFLETNETVAFIIIRDDTVLYEQFFDGYGRNSVIPVFSIAKSFVSALTGIAIDEGSIDSVDQRVTDYLDGFKHEGYENITIDDLLSMRSGIRFREDYFSPFGEVAKFYYGKNLKRYSYGLKLMEEPGNRYHYASVNVQLLAFILEKATGRSISSYLEEKIWTRTGMEQNATWSVDSKRNRTVKAFCCLNAVPYDIARFGRLYVNRGNWEGEQIISEEWIDQSLGVKYPSIDSRGYPYAYLWRSLENGSAFAKGILGQYLYIHPDKRLIMLRFGHSSNDIDWVSVFEEINDQL
jgi:CubicO group peptidase (beta-lactamase class C family)